MVFNPTRRPFLLGGASIVTVVALGENDASKALELSLIKYNGKFDPGFQTQWFTSAQVGQWKWQRWKNADFDALHEKGGITIDPAEREISTSKRRSCWTISLPSSGLPPISMPLIPASG